MGIGSSKHVAEQRAKISILEEEVQVIRREKEQSELVFSFERRKLKDEVAGLRKRVRRLAANIDGCAAAGGGGGVVTTECDQWWRMEMREEQVMRKEAAMEKWKQLYLSIKAELDQLILTTNQGEMLWWGCEEGAKVERLKTEVKAKEEALESLRLKLLSMEREGARREGEMDILRQSLKILTSSATRNRTTSNLKNRCLHF